MKLIGSIKLDTEHFLDLIAWLRSKLRRKVTPCPVMTMKEYEDLLKEYYIPITVAWLNSPSTLGSLLEKESEEEKGDSCKD